MGNVKDFYVLRYFVVDEGASLLPPKKVPDIKGETILETLLSNNRWETRGTEFQFIGFSKEPIDEESFYVGKIAKLKKAHLGVETSEDIVDQEADDWKAVILIVDVKNQFIFARKNSKFGDLSHICNSIQKGINNIVIPEYNHKVFVEPLPSKGKFWEVVENSEKIYKVELVMISPNIMETNKTARDALSDMKNLFNQDKTRMIMENSEGKLIVPYEPIDDYVDYIEEGEGRWELVIADNKTKKKEKYTSNGTPEVLDIDVEDIDRENEKLMDNRQIEMYEVEMSKNNKFLKKVKRYIEGKVRKN